MGLQSTQGYGKDRADKRLNDTMMRTMHAASNGDDCGHSCRWMQMTAPSTAIPSTTLHARSTASWHSSCTNKHRQTAAPHVDSRTVHAHFSLVKNMSRKYSKQLIAIDARQALSTAAMYACSCATYGSSACYESIQCFVLGF